MQQSDRDVDAESDHRYPHIYHNIDHKEKVDDEDDPMSFMVAATKNDSIDANDDSTNHGAVMMIVSDSDAVDRGRATQLSRQNFEPWIPAPGQNDSILPISEIQQQQQQQQFLTPFHHDSVLSIRKLLVSNEVQNFVFPLIPMIYWLFAKKRAVNKARRFHADSSTESTELTAALTTTVNYDPAAAVTLLQPPLLSTPPPLSNKLSSCVIEIDDASNQPENKTLNIWTELLGGAATWQRVVSLATCIAIMEGAVISLFASESLCNDDDVTGWNCQYRFASRMLFYGLALFQTFSVCSYQRRMGASRRAPRQMQYFWFLLFLVIFSRTFVNMPRFSLLQHDRTFIARTVSEWLLLGISFITSLLMIATGDKHPLEGKPLPTHSTPELQSSLLSYLTFKWLTPILRVGAARTLVHEDLYPLCPGDTTRSTEYRFNVLWNYFTGIKKNKVMWVLAATAMPSLLLSAGLKVSYDTLVFLSPMLLNRLVDFLTQLSQNNGSSSSTPPPPISRGLTYAGLMCCNAVVLSLLLHQYFVRQFRQGMRMRAALTGALYSKSLRLNRNVPMYLEERKYVNSVRGTTDTGGATIGQFVNLMAVDTQRVQNTMTYIQVLWSSPLQIIVSMVLLYNQISWAAFAGAMVFVLSVPCTTWLAKKQRALQRQLMTVKDIRLKMTSELLNNIRAVKMYAWEEGLSKRVNDVRAQELQLLWRFQMISAVNRALWSGVPLMVAWFSFACYTLIMHQTLTPAKAFTALALFNILRFPLQVFPRMLQNLVEAAVAARRIECFLTASETGSPLRLTYFANDAIAPNGDSSTQYHQGKDPVLEASDLELRWTPDGESLMKSALFTFKVMPGEKLAVIGSTGCGKTALLSGLMGELSIAGQEHSLPVTLRGSLAYCSQVPWIQNATVRDNITFNGKDINEEWYQKVVSACCLGPDLELMIQGDMTLIGERGVTLSGGQKQRVALARAVYAKATLTLMDDVLSAVDPQVGNKIFKDSIKGLMEDQAVIMVTHRLDLLSMFDRILFVSENGILFLGEYHKLCQLDSFKTYASSFARELEQQERDAEAEESQDGIIPPEAEKAGRKDPLVSTTAASEESPIVAQQKAKNETSLTEEKEFIAEGNVKAEVYWSYLRRAGGWQTVLSIAALLAAWQLCTALANVWLSYWADHSEGNIDGDKSVSNEMGIGMFSLLGFVGLTLQTFSTYLLAVGAQRAAQNMHTDLLKTMMRGTMNFFDRTPMGRIINRFSKDLYTIDESLPVTLHAYLIQFFLLISTATVIVCVTPGFIVVLAVIIILYRRVEAFYVPTSRQMQRIESALRSPIFVHFGETLDGTTTIRAFNMQKDFAQRNFERVDRSLQAYHMYVMSNRWLAMRLECMGAVIVGVVGFLAVFSARFRSLAPATGGLAISYALDVTNVLSWLVRSTSDRETEVVSVERLLEYIEGGACPPEGRLDMDGTTMMTTSPDPEWPRKGILEANKLSLRYRPNFPLALDNIEFSIKPGEKVGVVGRTGAGKTSLTVALLRLVEPEGYIKLDDIDLMSVELRELRSRISVIPQDFFLFSGTVRTNLDPLEQHSDEEIWDALELSRLKTFVENLPMKLDSVVEEGGRNFSSGQRQLVSLARVLIQNNKVLLLDEATSAVDPSTDALVQQALRSSKFSKCTIITIAHRIQTILDYDRIFMMENGKITQAGSPADLLQNSPEFQNLLAEAHITSSSPTESEM